MIVGSKKDGVNVANLIAADFNGARLLPRPLADGDYALPDHAAISSDTSAAHSILAEWDDEPSPTYFTDVRYDANTHSNLLILQSGKPYWQIGGRGNSTLTMPADNVFRFSAGQDDAYAFDLARGVRRSMIGAARDSAGFYGPMPGETAWCSFCLIPGDLDGVDSMTPGGSRGTLFMQWQSGEDPGISMAFGPPMFMDFPASGGFVIKTLSSAVMQVGGVNDGFPVPQVHYTGDRPAKGAKTYFVVETKFGASGYLKVWMNGSKIVDVVTPIGYYGGAQNNHAAVSGTQAAGWLCLGPYGSSSQLTDVIYIANPEWGLDSLAARINNPLSVPDLEW